ncbi:MAG: PilZ domain-containing protein [Planctomycetota bacterium]
MNRPSFRRRVEIRDDELQKLYTAMDAMAPPEESSRTSARVQYRVKDIPLCIYQAQGTQQAVLAYGRNISRGGLSVLHHGFVHKDAECTVILRQAEGEKLVVKGIVRHCRLVQGMWHELGIQFREEIDPRLILGSAMCEEHAIGDAATGQRKGSGLVLLMEPLEPDRLLLDARLTEGGYETISVATPGATLDAIQRQPIPMTMIGTTTLTDTEVRLIQRIRETGYTAPLTVLSADDSPNAVARARAAGASDCMAKPYDMALLLASIRTSIEPESFKHPLCSALQRDGGFQEHIDRYVGYVRRLSDQIEKAYQLEDEAQCRQLCLELKGSGSVFGYSELSVLSTIALKSIDDGLSSESFQNHLTILLASCRTLSNGSPSAPLAA